MEYSLIRLTDRPELKAQAAAWFHAKWGVPEQAYLDSMDDALREAGPVPQWYLVLESSRIIGGMGVIEDAERLRCLYRAGSPLPRHCGRAFTVRLPGYARKRHRYTLSADRPHRLLRALWLELFLHGPG